MIPLLPPGLLASALLVLAPQELPAEKLRAAVGDSSRPVAIERPGKATLYMVAWDASPDPATPILILLHQSGSSRAEYYPMVPRLIELGYNCLGVDLSSGGTCAGIRNRTYMAAKREGYDTGYLAALPDIEEALSWARANGAGGKLLLWGSSFSASLALYTAAQHPDQVDGVIAFSPGEYFTALGKESTWIQQSVRSLKCPVFLSASRAEQADLDSIFEAVASPVKQRFVPGGADARGSRALWPETAGHEETWAALESFLREHFAPQPPKAAEPPRGG